ncbi:metal-dependent transcriptional regulator [Halococcoides cellulosivorans]|nr:metal-dependent transcriptional regulator [Halococcoides cellulosivorans]
MSKSTLDADDRPVSPGEGRYLCGILDRQLRSDPPISNGALADSLGVSAASVTEMVEAFADRGFVAYTPYEGVELTDRGERIAREILWRRCTVEQYFERHLDVEMAVQRAYRVGRSLPAAAIEAMHGEIDRTCQTACEATTASDCPTLAP